VITSSELARASAALAADLQTRFLASSPGDKNRARLLAVYDLDDDGVISSDELLTVHQTMADREIDSLLARFDLNQDGDITCDEIRAALSSGSRAKTAAPGTSSR
jgi:Ca2+-binding EF-hand superfamily protein